MVTVSTTMNNLATTYAGYGSWVGLATAAYTRSTTTWGLTTSGVQAGTAVTLCVAAATYTYMLLASASTGANMYDNASITSVVMGANGQIVVTPTFTET